MPGESSSSAPLDRPAWRDWLADLPCRFSALHRQKLTLAAIATVGFCLPYFLIGNYPLIAVRELPLTPLDRFAGFHPGLWVWIYQSIYLPINLIPWLTRRREDLERYARAFALLCLISFTIFLLCPIRAPKPVVPEPTGMYWLLQQYDVPVNSMPSLHAGLLVMTLAYGRRIVGADLPRGLGAFCAGWAVLILYSTIATKEHYALDILAGAALGWGAHAWVWRQARPPEAVKPASAPHPAPLAAGSPRDEES